MNEIAVDIFAGVVGFGAAILGLIALSEEHRESTVGHRLIVGALILLCANAIEDPTNGADHYHTMARPGWAQTRPPDWARTMREVTRFGSHFFYDSRRLHAARSRAAGRCARPGA